MKTKEIFTKNRMLTYGKNTVMGIQHLFAMMGATILVPMLANMSISVALISAGFGTIIFFFVTKRMVPVFLGSSFAFLPALISALNKDLYAFGSESWMIQMGKVSGAILITGLVYVVFSLLVKFLGKGFLKKLFPPIVVGPVIIVIGMSLAPTVFSSNIAGAIVEGTKMTTFAVWSIAIVTALTIILVATFTKGFFKVIPILCGVLAGYAYSAILGVIDYSSVSNAAWIIFEPTAFQESFGWWKHFTFDAAMILAFAPIAIVTFMEHLGDINASSVVVGKNFYDNPGIHRTVLGDGLATMCAGLLGGPPNTTYGENTAVLAITKNYNPKLLVLAACFAVFLGVFSKFGGVLGSVPSPVIGGASMILFGMIAANGLKTMVEAKVDFSDTKNMLIVSIILVVGIGMSAAGLKLNIGIISFSPLAIVTVIGIILNLILPGKRTSALSATYGDESINLEDKSETENKKD